MGISESVMQHFRARVQKSGVTYYYFDAGGKPRKEIPLGSDYQLAVRQWSALIADSRVAAPITTFIDLIEKYEVEELVKLAKSTQATYRSDLKHLREFFGLPTPAPLDLIEPKHIKQMRKWKKDSPTTANRLKRLFSTIFNFGRGEGYTSRENPCKGITGHALESREVDINDRVFAAVWRQANAPTQDAMDLAEVLGQRPGDVLKLRETDIKDGLLYIMQGKTKVKRRIKIEGKLAVVIERILTRKKTYKVWSSALAVNTRGMPTSKQVLRDGFTEARSKAAAQAVADKDAPLRDEVAAFWFYDLRAKAADDVAEVHGDQAAADLLGHTSVRTTQKHYLHRGKIVAPSR